MRRTDTVPTPADLMVLADVIRHTTRLRRLSADDADDFRQWVHLRMLERNYEPFQLFGGRSSLRTYLSVVVNRLMLDWQDQMYGKWRASAEAKRLGAHAQLLERFIYRDGYSHEEAIELARRHPNAPSADALRQLIGRLPSRTRRNFVDIEHLETHALPFSDPIVMSEDDDEACRAEQVLAAALQRLTPEERMLLNERFHRAKTVRSLAEENGIAPRLLYRKFERILKGLRETLSAHGVTGAFMQGP